MMEFERGDYISIDSKPLCGPLWKVEDVVVKNLGLTSVTVVALYREGEVWSIQWTEGSEKATVSKAKEQGGEQYEVDIDSITAES